MFISQKNVLLTTISIQPEKTIKNTLIKLKFDKARSVPKNLSIEDCKKNKNYFEMENILKSEDFNNNVKVLGSFNPAFTC